MTKKKEKQPEINKHSYQEFLSQHKLMGTKCNNCGRLFLPPRPMCRECFSDDMTWVALGSGGKLLAYTIVHIAPTAMIKAGYGQDSPYIAGVVQLDDGPAISAQIMGVDATDPQSVAIGAPLRATFIERGEGDDKQTFLAFEVV